MELARPTLAYYLQRFLTIISLSSYGIIYFDDGAIPKVYHLKSNDLTSSASSIVMWVYWLLDYAVSFFYSYVLLRIRCFITQTNEFLETRLEPYNSK
jgi:hypothetical protein